MITFVVGLFVGAMFGALVMAIAAAGGIADEQAGRK